MSNKAHTIEEKLDRIEGKRKYTPNEIAQMWGELEVLAKCNPTEAQEKLDLLAQSLGENNEDILMWKEKIRKVSKGDSLSEEQEFMQALGRLKTLYLYDPPNAVKEFDIIKIRFGGDRSELYDWESKLERYRLLLEYDENSSQKESLIAEEFSNAPPTGEFIYPLEGEPSEFSDSQRKSPFNNLLVDETWLDEDLIKTDRDWKHVFHFLDKFDLYYSKDKKQKKEQINHSHYEVRRKSKRTRSSEIRELQKSLTQSEKDMVGVWNVVHLADALAQQNFQDPQKQSKQEEINKINNLGLEEQEDSFDDLDSISLDQSEQFVGFFPVFILGILVGIFLIASLVLWQK